MFAQYDQWQCSSEQSVTLKSREIISTIIIKENKFVEKAKRFSQKTRTHSSVGIVVLYLFEGRIMHAEEFVLIPKRMFISKNPTTEEIFDNPRYQQKTFQLPLLQRTIRISNEIMRKKYKMRTLTLIGQSRGQRVAVMQQVIRTM